VLQAADSAGTAVSLRGYHCGTVVTFVAAGTTHTDTLQNCAALFSPLVTVERCVGIG